MSAARPGRSGGRPRVGVVMTAAARARYVAPGSLERLERLAEVSFLELEGPSRVSGPPPDDPPTRERLIAFVGPLEVLVVSYGSPRVDGPVLEAAPRLRMVGDTHGDRFAARVDLEAARRRGVVVVDTTNASSDPVAEWALALLLVGLRNAGSHFRRLVAGEVLWPDREVLLEDPGYLAGELTGKTVGLIALGNVGRRLVSLLAPFGVSVLAHDPGVPAVLAPALGLELTSLEVVLERSDAVVCLAPLTRATHHLLGAPELELIRPGAVFVNVSRGAVVDTDALVSRLRRGDLVACLDVVDPEPLPAESPLRRMANVFLSPHIAGVTAACEPRFFDLMVDEVSRVLSGAQPYFPLVPREAPGETPREAAPPGASATAPRSPAGGGREIALARFARLLEDHVRTSCEQMMREPAGQLLHPYAVPSTPSSPYYSNALWDWDSWSVSIVLGQVEADTACPGRFADYERGGVLNFLEHADADGVVPIQLTPETALTHGDPSRAGGFGENMHKPVLAQHAALLVRRSHDAGWLRPHLSTIGRFVDRYLESHVHGETGLAYWQSDFAVGVDNDPSVFYRPRRSTAAVYLNSLLYRELLAYGYLLEVLGDASEVIRRRRQAESLADAVRAHLWDQRDGTFYSADIGLRPIDPEDWLHRGAPRAWSSLLLRVDSWSSFLPMWAGLASRDQAEAMVERLRDPRTFRSPYGVRTLSPLEKMYDLRASNNPSNWLGPVWGMSNYLVFRGLVRYRFEEDARDLAERTVRLLGRDLEASGALHELYHPETGEPIMTEGFQNWNFLVLNMLAWLEGREVVSEL